MSTEQNKDVDDLSKELKRIDGQSSKHACAMCRYVLILAFVLLLFIVWFAIFFKSESNLPTIQSLPQETNPPISQEEWDKHILDLGREMHGEQATKATLPDTLPADSNQ